MSEALIRVGFIFIYSYFAAQISYEINLNEISKGRTQINELRRT